MKMSPETVLKSMVRLATQLAPDELHRSDLDDHLKQLAPYLASGQPPDPAFKHERANWLAAETIDPALLKRLRTIVEGLEIEERPGYRVFRREVPVTRAGTPGAQPDWANGVAPERTVGPFLSRDGRQFWFDYYPIIQLQTLYLPGESDPALLFYVAGITAVTDINAVIRLFRGHTYNLTGSSIWIRADLIAPGAPTQQYVGLKIEGGELALSARPVDVAGKLTIPVGASCKVRLELASAAEVPAPDTGAGRDAQQAKIRLPEDFWFSFSTTERAIDKAGKASWELYGQKLNFQWEKDKSPVYVPALKMVIIPYRANKKNFSAEVSLSPFAQVQGEAAIQQSFWVLPASQIDIAQPTPAGGVGGLSVQLEEGMTLSWRGLRDGPIVLPNPWILLFPGLLAISDQQAGNRYARQRFLLWQDEEAPYRSSVDLRYTDSFPVYYAVNAEGSELISAIANAEARQDRPVDVGGYPFAIRSKDSLLILSYTDAQQLVYLYDNNIIQDNTVAPVGSAPPPIPRHALAIRNALFTVTPVNGYLLFAELLDEELVDKGSVLMTFGLYSLLPTLPDPYAANVGLFGRNSGRGGINTLLVAQVVWEKIPASELDTVVTNFFFAPVDNTTGIARTQAAVADTPSGVSNLERAATTGPAAGFDRRVPKPIEPEWDGRFHSFFNEQFALVDVSTNADWMGVSFAWFNPRQVDDGDQIFYRIYGAQDVDEDTQELYPVQVQGLDLVSQGRFVRAFTVPQISWEPHFNITAPQIPGDPNLGFNFFPNDGGPTRLFNDNKEKVAIAPLPKIEELLDYFHAAGSGFTGALFTLPFGLKAFAEFNKNHAYHPDAKLERNQRLFRDGHLKGGLQLQAEAPARTTESPMFIGGTVQLNNLVNLDGTPTGASSLGQSVWEIFNNEFFTLTSGYGDRGVPLERIDFSGYGASTFSNWENPEAAFAETSQARFDVFKGRTAHEVIQVKSVLYPWAVRVVRTITIFRVGSGYVYRHDSGWQAETPGLYDYSYRVKLSPVTDPVKKNNPFQIHPGIVKGVYNVKNITETAAIPPFERVWNKNIGDKYIDDAGVEQTVDAGTPDVFRKPAVKLQPVYFDADVDIEFVKTGAVKGKVPSKGMLGYVQLGPKGEPIPDFLFRDLLNEQFGSLGGPVDCIIDIGDSGQQMRLSRVDVSQSIQADNVTPAFAAAARGTAILPKDGAWSLVQYQNGSGEVTPMPAGATAPVVREGLLGALSNQPLRIENPMELVRTPLVNSIHYGLLQSTGTQKALFRKPRFEKNIKELLSETPDFADAYRMLNSSGIFPNLQDVIPMELGSFKTKIIEEGYKLLDEADPDKVLEKILPPGPWYIVDEDFLKIYIEYDKRDKNGNKLSDGKLNFGIDSAAAEMGKRWLSKVNDIGMVVDLGPLERLMMIKGKFDAEKGAAPSFVGPELEFGDYLQPVIDILQVLLMLQGGDYAAAFSKGLEIAMSNSAESWSYAFHARKEIPLVKFPPGPAYDNPTNPLKLEAGLFVGVYFNEVFSLTGNPQQLIPTAGAFLGFYGRLSVMCVSVAAATVYATGSVDLQIAADTKTGPSLLMKFGFGAEIAVGLPVIGTVTLLYMVGVEIYLDSTKVVTAAFLLFRGRAEILGGIVTVTITIEAKGIIERQLGPGVTNMIAQVTFALDISIFLVINIHVSKSWEVARQIA
jgi:hypothetical protein